MFFPVFLRNERKNRMIISHAN
ncbi:hypothetical protein CY0110_17647 [Crocosphaera chwakensis CCY0110]|uniref:Uncharacterized protein n=1 Tax=Crocosphaera chwakensis CCY0110 TaxID=391612 RepID=A3IIL1_9CHRO|nr:hypothetical protein CY0110_17647 [Crocosphaera chwakensis CCY0110]